MARHRARTGFTFSRARHRAPTRMQRGIEHAAGTALTALVAAILVMSMVGSDPSFPPRT